MDLRNNAAVCLLVLCGLLLTARPGPVMAANDEPPNQGKVSESQVIDQLGAFMVDRFQQEGIVLVIESLRKGFVTKSSKLYPVRPYFPETVKLVTSGKPFSMDALGAAWKNAMRKDLNALPRHVIEDSVARLSAQRQQDALRALMEVEVVTEVRRQMKAQNDPLAILAWLEPNLDAAKARLTGFLARLNERRAAGPAIALQPDDNFDRVVEALKLLSRIAQTARWQQAPVPAGTAGPLLPIGLSPTTCTIDTTNPDSATQLLACWTKGFAQIPSDKLAASNANLQLLAGFVEDLQALRAQIVAGKASAPSPAEQLALWLTMVPALEGVAELGQTAGDSGRIGQWMDRLQVLLEIQKGAEDQNYALVVTDLTTLYTGYACGDPAPPDCSLPEGFSRMALLAVGVANAQTEDDVAKALQSYTAPVGSYKIKRTADTDDWVVTINGYLGGFVGQEKLTSEPAIESGDRVGVLTAMAVPLGFEWKPRGVWNKMSFFLPVIDLGAVVSERRSHTDVTTQSGQNNTAAPPYTFRQLLTPGIYLMFGLGDSPVSLGFGTQYTPNSRALVDVSTGETRTVGGYRYGMILAMDIPLFFL